MKAPLQTDIVRGARALVSATHFSVAALSRAAFTPPPGTRRRSGGGASANVYFGTTVMPSAVVTGARDSATA